MAVGDRAITPDGVGGSGHYDPVRRRITFALSMFVGTQGVLTNPEARKAMIVSVAAHEAMHAVQHARGDDVDAGPKRGEPEYFSSPLEIEAHQESLLMLRGYHAEIRMSLPLGDRYYEVPPTSPYTSLWEDVRRCSANVRVLSMTEG
ncbi:MAG: hypothetical protein ACREX3_00390 [Gammaproteobacteria bacterium]